jgi:hypothetical protein
MPQFGGMHVALPNKKNPKSTLIVLKYACNFTSFCDITLVLIEIDNYKLHKSEKV